MVPTPEGLDVISFSFCERFGNKVVMFIVLFRSSLLYQAIQYLVLPRLCQTTPLLVNIWVKFKWRKTPTAVSAL
jgi:hypothetical protein